MCAVLCVCVGIFAEIAAMDISEYRDICICNLRTRLAYVSIGLKFIAAQCDIKINSAALAHLPGVVGIRGFVRAPSATKPSTHPSHIYARPHTQLLQIVLSFAFIIS